MKATDSKALSRLLAGAPRNWGKWGELMKSARSTT